jgi:hypothetical protein
MDNQKFNLVLDKILEKTGQGKLEWETTANRNTFLAVLQDSAISITRSFNDYDGLPIHPSQFYTFDFRNENGDIVESIDIYNSKEDRKNFEKANQIFDLARHQPSKIDKTLDHILEQLAA